jgi:hypothetical protein
MKRSIALLAAAILLVVAASALGAGGRVPVQITLKTGQTVGQFTGKVKSEVDTCAIGRKVRIVRVSGNDIRVGKGFTDSDGKYSIQTTETSGDWIAKVKHETIGAVVCKGAMSRIASAG